MWILFPMRCSLFTSAPYNSSHIQFLKVMGVATGEITLNVYYTYVFVATELSIIVTQLNSSGNSS